MTPFRLVACVLAAAAIFLGGYGIRAMQPSASASSASALEHRLDQIEQRLARMDGSSASAPAGDAGDGAPMALRGPRRALALGNDATLGRRSVAPQDIARMQKARVTELDAAFRGEPVGPEGAARQAEAKLSEAASSDDLVESGITPTAIDTQCRSKQCRVVTRFPADSDAEGWASLYVLSASNTLASAQAVVTPLDDGTLQLAIYGTRN